MMDVRLVDLTKHNWEQVAALEVGPGQEQFVAPNLRTIAETQFEPSAVRRVIVKGGVPIGLAVYVLDPEDDEWWLWRFMIARDEQGRGHGRAALEQLIDEWRAIPGCTRVFVGYKPENMIAERLYVSLGFVPGGMAEWGERIARLDLSRAF
jgi:diamine N-acetyltransferase